MVRRETDEENTSRPDDIWPDMWTICLMQRKAKQSKSGLSRIQSSKNTKQIRGIFFIEPEDEKFKHTMKNDRRKLENSGASSKYLVKTPLNFRGETCRNIGKHKTKYACIVDADESMRIRLEGVPHRYHEDRISAKGITSLSHYNLVHKFIPMPQALKMPHAKAAVEKMGKLKKNLAWQLTKVRNKKKGDRSSIRSWSLNFKSTKTELYSEVTL